MIRNLLAALTLALAVPLAPATLSAQPISADDLAEPAFLIAPHLSPDGRMIAAVSRTDEGDRVILSTVAAGGQPESLNLAPFAISNLDWAGNDRLLVTVLVDKKLRGRTFTTSRLVIYDRKTGQFMVGDKKARGIMGGEVLHIDPDGRFAIVASQRSASEYPEVRRVDLATGEAETVQKAIDGVWDWYTDDRGVVRLGLSYDDKRYRLYYREEPGEKLRKIKGKFDRDDDEADNGVIERIFFGRDERRDLVLTNGPTGRFALYEYDVENEQVGALVWAHDSVDIERVIRDDYGRVLGVLYEDDRRHVEWFDPTLKKIQADLDATMPEKENRILSFSRDRTRLLVRSGAPDDAGQYLLADLAVPSITLLYRPFKSVDAARLSPARAVEYAARDGLSIPAYLTIPKGREERKLPLILLPHGGPFARDSWTYDPVVQFFASRGYAVFQPQFRGSTGYGRAFVDAGTGEWGRGMQDDLNDGLDWLTEQGIIDPDRVCIVGASYGGYAAMWGAIRDPERYRCAASFAGVSDLEDMLKHDKGQFSAKRYYRNWRDQVAGSENWKDLDRYSPVDHAEKLRVPLFLAHGEKDDNVPVDQTEDMAKALAKAGIEADVVYYEDLGHFIYYEDAFADWLKRLGSFVARHNPAS